MPARAQPGFRLSDTVSACGPTSIEPAVPHAPLLHFDGEEHYGRGSEADQQLLEAKRLGLEDGIQGRHVDRRQLQAEGEQHRRHEDRVGPETEPERGVALGTDRERVAELYSAQGLPTRPDEVLVTTGAQQAIGLVTTLLGEAGQARW